MSEMVERVAKVLYELKCAEVAADESAPYRGPFAPFEELLKAKDAYMADARAIIEELQKLKASGRYQDWQAMIDRALT